MSVFPGAIDSTTQLKVATDNIATTLAAGMLVGDTTMQVVNATGIVAHSIATVDNEQVAVWSVAGNVITIGDSSANNLDGRGFNGTAVAAHAINAPVQLLIDAYFQKALSDAVIAIETALGINLANVPAPTYPIAVNKGGTNAITAGAARASLGAAALGANADITSLTALALTGLVQGNGAAAALTGLAAASEGQGLRRKYNAGATPVYEFASPVLLFSSDFIFTAQQPGGSLIVGSNTIALSPVPQGVNGTDANHYLYISSGTGTAEACLITGGTAVGGSASGTVIVTCAHTHSGAWTIQSATAGIQEAIVSGNGLPVYMPAGTWQTYAPITIPAAISPEVFGSGMAQTILAPQFLAGDVIGYAAGNAVASFRMHDFAVMHSASASSGYCVAVRSMASGLLSNIRTSDGYNAILFEGGNGEFSDNLHLTGYANAGVDLHSTAVMGGVHRNWLMSGSGTAVSNLLLRADAGGGFAGLVFDALDLQLALANIEIFSNGGVCNEILFNNTLLDSALTGGWGINAHGSPGGNGIHFSGLRCSTAGGGILSFTGGFSDVMISNFSGSTSSAANAPGFQFAGTQNVALSNCNVSGNGQGNAANTSLVITTDPNTGAAVNALHIANSSFGYNSVGAIAGGTNIAYDGCTISAAAHTRIQISNSAFYGTHSRMTNAATAPIALSGFIGGITDDGATVASAATTVLPIQPIVTLTGNTAVTNVTVPLAVGARWFITATHATPGAWTAGGLIGNTFTPVQNVPFQLFWDGTHVWKL